MTYSVEAFQYWGHFILYKTWFILLNNSASKGNLSAYIRHVQDTEKDDVLGTILHGSLKP